MDNTTTQPIATCPDCFKAERDAMYEALKAAQEWLQSPPAYQATHLPPTRQIDAALLIAEPEIQYADREETGPTCRGCFEILDEDRDEFGICKSCEREEESERRVQDAWDNYEAARSQYHHLREN